MSMARLDRWSGLAAAVGGVLWLFPWTGWFVEVDDTAGFLMAIAGLLLVMIGFVGLNRRIGDDQSRSARLAFAAALLGAGLVMASALAGLLTGASRTAPDIAPMLAVLLFGGVLIMILGLGGMGVIALRQKALGPFSFAPLLLTAALVGYVISVGISVGNPALEILHDVFIALSYVGWLFFGYALATGEEQRTDPAVQT